MKLSRADNFERREYIGADCSAATRGQGELNPQPS